MLKFKNIIVTGMIFSAYVGNAQAEIKTKNLGKGWTALTQQTDPFDSSKIEVIQIIKGSFIYRCNELNMSASSYGYESLSFKADLKYIVDSNAPIDKKGRYATYLGGSDLVMDTRYYSFQMSTSDIEEMKKGNNIKVAGNYMKSGWVTESLNLAGFTDAYNKMCN